MTTLVTNKFREHIASQFIESINEPANNVYYIVASKHTPYANGDSTAPTPYNTNSETEIVAYEEGIFGKKVNVTDLSLMIPKIIWTSGTVYDHYDQDDAELFTKDFYVAVDAGSTYYVYKCLDNNGGVESVTQPSSTSESACNFITTTDGYTWKLMYKMPEASFEKFATADYMPVVTSANVSSNTVSGALDVIRITTPGSHYVATLSGQFQVDDLRTSIPSYSGNNTTYRLATNASSNTNFYVGSAIYIASGTGAGQIKSIISYDAATRVAVVNNAFTTAPSSDSTYVVAPNITITGDGTNATAYATVSSNSSVNNFISKINIVTRGSNYTYASATITGNTGGISNSAVLKAIVPPVGGHGYDSPSELGSKSVGVSVSFNTDESGYITTENDYRKVILLRDPLFKSVTLTLDTEVGTFSAGETVYQIDVKRLTGTVAGNNSTTTITGTSTQFIKSLKSGDSVKIIDNSTGTACLRTVDTVSNSTSIALTSALPFITSYATIAYVDLLASGVKSGNASPYITLTNTTPKFVTGKVVIGAASGATANVTSIDVQEKDYNNWSTFDNRTRISYTSNTGTIGEDSVVYQTSLGVSNAYYHSANSTYVFLTSEKGPINADAAIPLQISGGSNTFVLGTNKYNPDIVKGSGKVLYIENNVPISRSPSQSETIRVVLNF